MSSAWDAVVSGVSPTTWRAMASPTIWEATRLARSSGRSRPTREARGRSNRWATSSRIVAAAASSDAAARIRPVTVLRPSELSRRARMNSATRRPSPCSPAQGARRRWSRGRRGGRPPRRTAPAWSRRSSAPTAGPPPLPGECCDGAHVLRDVDQADPRHPRRHGHRLDGRRLGRQRPQSVPAQRGQGHWSQPDPAHLDRRRLHRGLRRAAAPRRRPRGPLRSQGPAPHRPGRPRRRGRRRDGHHRPHAPHRGPGVHGRGRGRDHAHHPLGDHDLVPRGGTATGHRGLGWSRRRGRRPWPVRHRDPAGVLRLELLLRPQRGLAVLAIAGTLALVPRSVDEHPPRLDLVGAALSLVAVAARPTPSQPTAQRRLGEAARQAQERQRSQTGASRK